MLLGSGGARGLGLDISDASLSTTRSLLAFHDVPESRYALTLGDLRETLPVPTGSQNAATCFEVLEHLDDPRHALEEIHRILAPGAPLCVSAAVRMESVDHLYVFTHPKEVRALLSEVGFTVVADDAIPLTASPSDSGAFVDDPRVSLGYIALAVS
jgi:ubiquinone/menaquinone biosynthesis C-methylase UbiE